MRTILETVDTANMPSTRILPCATGWPTFRLAVALGILRKAEPLLCGVRLTPGGRGTIWVERDLRDATAATLEPNRERRRLPVDSAAWY